jgi:transcriptional regulator with XRE-family HTH domain
MGELVRLPPRPKSDQAEPLWRELVGAELRTERQSRGERLSDVADRAGVSTQYLSEVERGLKDPSSEILAAVVGALDLTVRQLTIRVAQAAPQAGPRPSSPRGTTLCLAA